MKSTPDPSPDSLVKRLYSELQMAGLDGSDLREWGCVSFLRSEHPHTTDPVEMAVACLLYTACDGDGHWQFRPSVLQACASFLEHETQIAPTPADWKALIPHLKASPVDKAAVRDWFLRVYPRPQNKD